MHVAQRLTTLAKGPDERVALAVALVVRALRGGSVCVDLRSVEAQVGVADLPWPAVDDWLAAVQAESRCSDRRRCCGSYGDLLYLDRYWLEEQQVCDDLLAMLAGVPEQASPGHRPAVPAGLRGAARGRGNRAVAGVDGADRRARARARRRRSRGCSRCWPSRRSAGLRRSRWRHRPARRRRDCRRRCSWRSTSSTPADRAAADRPAGDDAAPAAGQPAGHVGAVPAPPRQSAAARRHRGRRDVDGVADDDGAAAGGGAPGHAADPGRRSRPAGVGGSRRGAGGSGRRALGDDVASRGAEDVAPVRRVDRRAGRRRSGTATRTRVVEVLRAGGEHIEWVDTDDPSEHLRKVLVPHALRLRQGGDPRRRGRGAGHTGRAPAVVRAPPRAVRGAALEPPGASGG